ncbi:hypothetical protein HHK36_016670 [Tetracentron sinense]|uniref:Uncharacterized protein n=1 Tax=Tetracentron sinense TaxID=13715 RepID=A0A834Z3U2_TETSI|nr:hypothetical protein HHK36_016670 [Tetracentron sinense]
MWNPGHIADGNVIAGTQVPAWRMLCHPQEGLWPRWLGDVQREEKSVQKAIREAAKRNDMVSAKAFSYFGLCDWELGGQKYTRICPCLLTHVHLIAAILGNIQGPTTLRTVKTAIFILAHRVGNGSGRVWFTGVQQVGSRIASPSLGLWCICMFKGTGYPTLMGFTFSLSPRRTPMPKNELDPLKNRYNRKALAKEIVRSRQAVNRLHENKAQLNSISMHIGESVVESSVVGCELCEAVAPYYYCPTNYVGPVAEDLSLYNIVWKCHNYVYTSSSAGGTYASDYAYNRCLIKFLIEVMIQISISRTVGHMSKSAEVMKLVNNLMKAPEVAATMQEFSKEMTKAGVIEEMVNDAVDTALDSEDIEEETEEEVDKVLTELAGETAAQLPEAVRRERIKQPGQTSKSAQEEEAIAEGADDEEELEEIRARLAKVRS